MKTAFVQYPLEKVRSRIKMMLYKRNFSILSSDDSGVEFECEKRIFFFTKIHLKVTITLMDHNKTRIDAIVNNNLKIYHKASNKFEKQEELFITDLSDYF